MFGYWENPDAATNSSGGGQIEIGLPPLIQGTKDGSLIDGLFIGGTGNDWNREDIREINAYLYKKTFKGTYGGIEINNRFYPDFSGDYYMFLPSNFKGYTTKAQAINTGIYKTEFLNDDVYNAQTISTQKVYKIGIDVYKLSKHAAGLDPVFNAGNTLYEEVETYAQYFQAHLFDDSNIPVFTGSFRTGGGAGTIRQIKQNRHYAAIGRSEIDLLTLDMMPRWFIFGNNNYNTATYGSGTGDLQFSNGNAEGGRLRSGITTLMNNTSSLVDWATSGTNANIIPWYINLTSGARCLYNRTNGNMIDTLLPRITPPASRANGQQFFDGTQFIMVNNSGNSIYNARYGWAGTHQTCITCPLPATPRNKKLYGGVGIGELDKPIIDLYQHPRISEWKFAANDAARYCFIEAPYNSTLGRHSVNQLIFIVVYFTNDVIEIDNKVRR